jgi:hypothetical protein
MEMDITIPAFAGGDCFYSFEARVWSGNLCYRFGMSIRRSAGAPNLSGAAVNAVDQAQPN